MRALQVAVEAHPLKLLRATLERLPGPGASKMILELDQSRVFDGLGAAIQHERIKALRTSNTVSVVQQNEAELALRNAELAKREAEPMPNPWGA